MLLSLFLVSGCITLDNNDCTNQQYLALNGDCIQDPGPTDVEIDTADPDLDGDDDGGGGDGGTTSSGATDGGTTGDDGQTDADDGSDADADGTDADGSGGDPLLESIDVTCDAGSWYYSLSTAIATESATVTVIETGSDDATKPEEFHTLTMAGESTSGGETYERDLLLVAGYYFEDVATQFPCVDGSNDQLTWKVDVFSDAERIQPLGCATWGHDTSLNEAAGCQLL